MEDPEALQAALRELREYLVRIGASKSGAVEFAKRVERLARAFCAGELIGTVRDPLSPHKPSIRRLAKTLSKASIVARNVQSIPEAARDLSAYRKARSPKGTSLAFRDFVHQLDTWAVTTERLLHDIETRRGGEADEEAHALYTQYALGLRRCTGEWPRGWRQAERGGEPESWRLLNMIVGAISARTESRLTPKRLHRAVHSLDLELRPVSKTSKK